jgi:uncharacterized protein (DUF2141 family)
MFLAWCFRSLNLESKAARFKRRLFDRGQKGSYRPKLEMLGERTLLSFGPPTFYPGNAPGSPAVAQPGGLAIGDFHRNGILDLVMANEASNNISVLTGDANRDGGFQNFGGTFSVGKGPAAVAVGDFGSATSILPDGKPDIVVVNETDSDFNLLINDGEGGFTSYKGLNFGVGANPDAVAVADFNHDGLLDVATANFGGNNVTLALRRSDGGFNTANYNVGSRPAGVIAVGDFNNDGAPDLAVPNFGDGTLSVLLGKGDGTFQVAQSYPVGSEPTSVAVGDFNRDGVPDLVVTNQDLDRSSLSVLLGKGDGTFATAVSYQADTGPHAVVVDDFNGDGKLDLAVDDLDGVSLLLGNGDGTFQSAVNRDSGLNASAIVAGDFNGDGKLDIAMAGVPLTSSNGQSPGGVSVLLNQAASATVLHVTPSPSIAGQSVTLTATVSAVAPATGTPTGTVTFLYNGNSFTQGLSGGVAILNTIGALAAGSNVLTAIYNGDSNFGGSSGQVSTFVDAPLSATGVNVTVAHGIAATNVTVATFTDADPNGTAGQFTATITWGDGTAPSAGTITASGSTFTVAGTHTFVAPGRYTVSAAIQDSGGSTAAATSKAVIGSLNERFVSQAYRDLLQRPVDATGLQVFTAALDAGLPPSQVSQSITSSQEYRTDLIAADYQLFLHRTADLGGLSNFLNFLATGGTDEQVAVALTGSAEYFQNRGGGTNDGFLTALFQDALGRPIDAGGRASFNQQLAGGTTRGQVAATIFVSTEYRQDLVGGYYLRFLHRPADSAGLANFVSALGNGAKDEDVVAALVGSGEYLARL